jgi:hypothetical protein
VRLNNYYSPVFFDPRIGKIKRGEFIAIAAKL